MKKQSNRQGTKDTKEFHKGPYYILLFIVFSLVCRISGMVSWWFEKLILSDIVRKTLRVLFCHCECSEAISGQVGDCFAIVLHLMIPSESVIFNDSKKNGKVLDT